MKATIEYDVSGDDKEDYDLMNQSRDMHLAVHEFMFVDEFIHILERKYEGKDIVVSDLICDTREHLYNIMANLNVSLDKLS